MATVIPRSMTDRFRSLQNVPKEYGRATASRPTCAIGKPPRDLLRTIICHTESYFRTHTASSLPLTPMIIVEEYICGELSCVVLQILILLRGHHR